ncbi:hypothetical protein Bca4012_061260 [Brassica carinata]
MDVDMLFIEEKAKLFQDSVKVHRLVVPFLSIMVPSPAVSVTLWLRTLEALTTISKTNLYSQMLPKLLSPEIKTSNLKGAQSIPSKASGKKIFAKADDIQNQAQPLEEALNRMTCSWYQTVPRMFFLRFCGGEAGSSSTTSKYGGVKELESVTLQELNSYVLNSTPHLLRGFTSSSCDGCNDDNVGVVRFRVQMTLKDVTDAALFVAFVGAITKLSLGGNQS